MISLNLTEMRLKKYKKKKNETKETQKKANP